MSNNDKKEQLQAAHGKLASWLVGLGVPANWAKVGGGLIIGAFCGALATCQQACSTPEQLYRVQAVHALYHSISGKPCILPAKPEPAK